MNHIFATDYSHHIGDILHIIKNFKNEGTLIGPGTRNIVKWISINNMMLNFKSFKQHNIINRHVYKYYRKSKAKRSFEYAHLLISKNFYTPKPIAYVEFHDCIGLTNSYYISEQLENSFTLQDVFLGKNSFEDWKEIVKGYTLLIYQLHEQGIEFIDNSPGNFLLKKMDNEYRFFLVDLNRMNFHHQFEIYDRFKNFARLTNDPDILKIISLEYSLLSGISQEHCLEQIVKATKRQETKRKIKKVLKFYKYFLK
ncbi:lipopolysaccharide kinase [Chryseobacterium angstadtii]|uniref:Lipopolysaccharide kinase n=1 Tax=Chryseobacterium angstadtii TaxID=558151 RepID=A0A0J7IF49_9FLAO|nr:lipopolysaccharide kinase InaA family protein [Chryseobacterium angstadtii]KMQ65058.1 lipopolysaccharide kinase [Chryseobacterium angstadtii]